MMNTVNLRNGNLIENNPMDLSISVGEYTILFYSPPALFGNEPFNADNVRKLFKESLSDIIPFCYGGGYCILEKNGAVVEIAVDYYAHSRVYYSVINGNLYISDDWRELPHETMRLNVFQILYFLNWDSCLNGETYFDEIKYFAPTFLYAVKDNSISKKFIVFPELNSSGLFESVGMTIAALKELYGDQMGEMLSGGIDSSLLALAAKKQNCKNRYFCANIIDIDMFDSKQDMVGARTFAEQEGLDFSEIDVKIKNFLNGWKGELPKYVAFSYKDGRLWQGIAQNAKLMNINTLITGLGADTFYNYAFTGTSEYDTFMRKASTDKILEEIFLNEEYSNAEELWKMYNKDDFSKEGYLSWFIIKGNGYKGYKGLVVDKLCKKNIRQLYKEKLFEKMRELITLLDEGKIKSPRHLLIEGNLIGHMDGENTRSICGACEANGVKALHVYSSPYVLASLIRMQLGDEDVLYPKRLSTNLCKQSAGFNRAQLQKNQLVKTEELTAGQVWEEVYKILDSEYDFEKCQQIAMDVLGQYELFEEERIKEIVSNDIGLKLRFPWFGFIYSIYEKSLI